MFPYKKIRSHELVFKKSENLTRVKRTGFRTFKNVLFCGFPGLWTPHKYKNIFDRVTACCATTRSCFRRSWTTTENRQADRTILFQSLKHREICVFGLWYLRDIIHIMKGVSVQNLKKKYFLNQKLEQIDFSKKQKCPSFFYLPR